jgi:hypothetical protein
VYSISNKMVFDYTPSTSLLPKIQVFSTDSLKRFNVSWNDRYSTLKNDVICTTLQVTYKNDYTPAHLLPFDDYHYTFQCSPYIVWVDY